MSPPEPGPKARPANTGTGAQMRVKFPNPDVSNPQNLFACAPSGGLFRTNNVLDSVPIWENITDSTRLPVLGVRDFEFVPGNPNIIYAGTGLRYPLEFRRGHGIGVLKSTDGGKSWHPTGLSFQQTENTAPACHEIWVHPTHPDTLMAICAMNLYKSVDAGATFELKKTLEHPNPAGWGYSFRDLVSKPGKPEILYLTSDANYFYQSLDGGESWTEMNVSDWGIEGEVDRMDIVVSSKNPELIYLACKTKSEVILRSLDGGTSWQVVFDKKLNTSYEKHAFAISPNNENILYFGGLYVTMVDLSGAQPSFTTIGGGEMHLDHRDLLVVDDGNGNDIIYAANDGGLYRGTLDGKKWRWRDVSGVGFNNMQFYGIGVAEDFSIIPGGTQDLGVMLIRPDGKSIKPAVGGDGADCAVDKYDPNYVYGVSWAIGPPRIVRSTDGGVHWGDTFEKGLKGKGDTYYFQLNSHNSGNIYAGKEDVFRLPHKEDEWIQVGDINLRTDLPFRITAMCVAPSDARVIYAYGDQLYKTINGLDAPEKVEWQALGKNMENASATGSGLMPILAVEVGAANPKKVWVSFNSYQSEDKIFYSGNGGETWKSVSRGLPPFPVTSLAFQAGTEDVLYAGTDVGVFYNPRASDPASEWLCFNSGLPVCIVADLEMNYCEGKIVVGTFGRGIWASPFASPSVFEKVEIKADTVWDFAMLQGDVTVKKGSTLTLKGEIRAMPGIKIHVEKRAHLMLDGAHIKGLCKVPWGGIEVEEGSNGLFSFIFGKKSGSVELKNGAVVEDATFNLPNN